MFFMTLFFIAGEISFKELMTGMKIEGEGSSEEFDSEDQDTDQEWTPSARSSSTRYCKGVNFKMSTVDRLLVVYIQRLCNMNLDQLNYTD